MKIRNMWLAAAVLAACLLAAGCGAKTPVPGSHAAGTGNIGAKAEDAEEKPGNPAAAAARAGNASQEDITAEGMARPGGNALKDGVYPIKADSSSNMFRITECELTVKDGRMSAVMTMGGTGYLKLFMGTGREALKASEKNYIPYVETAEGTHTFAVPVEALDLGIDCAAYSKNKEEWYDRELVFRSDSLPSGALADGLATTVESLNLEDGMYTAEVRLEGGSGRASVESPAAIRVESGKAYASIIWGSSNYDYMKVNDRKFDVMGTEGNSAFEIPVSGFDWKMPVTSDTIAMGSPHEIDYILIFDSATLDKTE